MAGRRTQKRGKIGRSGDVGGRNATRAAARVRCRLSPRGWTSRRVARITPIAVVSRIRGTAAPVTQSRLIGRRQPRLIRTARIGRPSGRITRYPRGRRNPGVRRADRSRREEACFDIAKRREALSGNSSTLLLTPLGMSGGGNFGYVRFASYDPSSCSSHRPLRPVRDLCRNVRHHTNCQSEIAENEA
jgi:hypothetical protein